MSKGKSKASRQVPELQDGATSSSTAAIDQPVTPKGSICANRLPSLHPKRDLSLGGSPQQPSRNSKKTYAPTIPARRKKVAVPAPAVADESSTSHGRGRERRERGRGRGRGRGRRDRDIITSASVFSMGPAERLMQKRESVGETFGSFKRSDNPNSVRVKQEDGERDSNYRLHFSDKGEDEEEEGGREERVGLPGGELFSNSKLPPVMLPLDYSRHAKNKTVSAKNKIVKQEAMEEGEESAQGAQPATVKLLKPAAQTSATQSHPDRMTAAKLFAPSEGAKGQFLFFQLPDCLPLVGGANDTVAMDISSTATPTSSKKTTDKDKVQQDTHNLSSLRDLPEGHIGKIRIHKSGKVKLVLGENSLDVTMGTPTGFLQQLVGIHRERDGQERPSMVVLGQLAHRVICTPDFESLLSGGSTTAELQSTTHHDSSDLNTTLSDHEQPMR